MKRVEITVTGRVQGVGFRAFIKQAAETLGIDGEVKNMPDGSVFIIAEGEDIAIERIIDAAKEGPRMSSVESASFDYFPVRGDYSDFSITR